MVRSCGFLGLLPDLWGLMSCLFCCDLVGLCGGLVVRIVLIAWLVCYLLGLLFWLRLVGVVLLLGLVGCIVMQFEFGC